MENYQRIRFTAENYYSLQGLRYVPALIFALIVSVGERIPLYRPGNLEVRLVLLLLSLGASYLIGRYYQQHFGRVEISRKVSDWVVIIALVVGVIADNALSLPISLTGLIVAVFWAYHWQQSKGLRSYYAVFALISFIGSLLPLVIKPIETAYFWTMLVILLAALVGAVLDHLLLLQITQRPRED